MAKKPAMKPAQVVAALKGTGGRVYLAAARLKVAVQTVYNYAKRHPEVQEAIEQSRGERLDKAEDTLWQAVEKGEAWAVCFFLKTQGKSRGYVERQEVDSTATAQVALKWTVKNARGGTHEPASGDPAPPGPA